MSELILEKNEGLPNNWKITKMHEISELIRGVTYKKTDSSTTPNSNFIAILRGNNIQSKLIFEELVHVPKKYVNEEQFLKKNDVVITMSSGSKHLVGKSARVLNDIGVSFGAFCACIRPSKVINGKFFAYFFQSDLYKKSIQSKSLGININNLRREHIENLEIPIPPLNEQKRIVSKIEEFFSLLDSYENELRIAQIKISTLINSVFQTGLTGYLTSSFRNTNSLTDDFSYLNNFSNPQEKHIKEIEPDEIEQLPKIPSNWSWIRLGKICLIKDVDHKMPEAVKDGIPFVSPKDFQDDGTIDFENTKKISKSDFIKNSKKTSPRVGDILFSRYGTLGKAILVPDKEFGLSYSIAVIRPFFEEINLIWLHFLLQSPFVLHQAISGEQSSTMADLGLITIRNFLIPLPHYREQKIIASILDDYITNLYNQLKQIQLNLKYAKHIKISIFKQTFEGKLVPQDPNDEPAEILLQKIRKEKEQLEQKIKPRRKKNVK